MAQVRYEPWGRTVDVPPGRNLLQAAIRDRIPLRHDCGGHASCSTCRVEVLEGGERLSPRGEDEVRLLGDEGLGGTWRLACQVRPRGDAVVRAPEGLRGYVG